MPESRQMKVTIDAELAEAFKAACASEGVSMASQISYLMRTMTDSSPAVAYRRPSLATRRQRRRAARLCAEEVERIRDAEDAYRDRIPENLTGGEACCAAEDAADALDQAAELLRGAFE